MSGKTVFISYSHDSDEHAERVRGLHASLSRDGCECRLDVYKETDEDWPLWMTEQLIKANFILCVVSETYEKRFHDKELPDVGKGVGWEAGLIRRLLYAKKLHNDRIFPVLFERANEPHIPLELQGFDFFLLDSPGGYEALLRKVLNRPLYAAPEIGPPPDLDTTVTRPLFERPTVQTESHRPESKRARYDIDRIIKYAPAELIGRKSELALLDDAWAKAVRNETNRPHILTFVGLGGEGKTSIIAKWAAELSYQRWPRCEAAFAWSFYTQGTGEKTQTSSDSFLKEALLFFSETDSDIQMATSDAGAFDKGKKLAQLIGERRALLILDGLEPLQYAPASPTGTALKDEGVSALLKALATKSDGLCVVTTGYSIPDLQNFWQSTAPEKEITSLSTDAGVDLLKLKVKGTTKELEQLVTDVKGHALTLNLIGSYLRDAHGGDIRKRDRVRLEKADAAVQSGHAFHVMDAYVQSFKREREDKEEGKQCRQALSILRLLGLFDRPATADCLNALWTGEEIKDEEIKELNGPLIGIGEDQQNITLKRLEDAHLITINRDRGSQQLISLDAHPLLREYFAKRVREELPGAWRAANRRLYEHLSGTKEGEQPTLEDLRPLYQAVAHGCKAGLQAEVFRDLFDPRILRGDQTYVISRLGAFGIHLGGVSCFFEQQWSKVAKQLAADEQAKLFKEAGICLQALGRLREASAAMQEGLSNCVPRRDWEFAATFALDLSLLDLTLGDLKGALLRARQSVKYARLSGKAGSKMITQAIHGHALHEAGYLTKAEKHFDWTEKQRSKSEKSNSPYSLEAYFYCDLLLSEVEALAWRTFLRLEVPASKIESAISSCNAASDRANEELENSKTNRWTRDIGLHQLTKRRAGLYKTILAKSDARNAQSGIDDALDALRHADTAHLIPSGLLIRAFLRGLIGQETGPISAQNDLDEAWEIAERGPMRLHMADIHLYRARLFHAVKPYPWNEFDDGREGRGPKDDLADARKLIEQCGYWRRKEELEDAEEAAKNW